MLRLCFVSVSSVLAEIHALDFWSVCEFAFRREDVCVCFWERMSWRCERILLVMWHVVFLDLCGGPLCGFLHSGRCVVMCSFVWFEMCPRELRRSETCVLSPVLCILSFEPFCFSFYMIFHFHFHFQIIIQIPISIFHSRIFTFCGFGSTFLCSYL